MKGRRFALHCVGLQHLGRGRGFRSRAAVGSIKLDALPVVPMGVNPRLEVGGSACFPLALRSPVCGCFCLRLDFHVTVSVRGGQGSQPGFLVLAFSARTLKSSGVPEDECRPGASAWACCLWFVTLLHVRGSWSSCVFVRSLLSGCVCFWCLCAGRIYSSEELWRRASRS